MTESKKKDKWSGFGMIFFYLSFTTGIMLLFLGYFDTRLAVVGLIIILASPLISSMLVLVPEYFPKTKKRRREHLGPTPSEKPSHRVYVGIVVVTLFFLVILYGMNQAQIVSTKEAIIIAVFTILFEMILSLANEYARKR